MHVLLLIPNPRRGYQVTIDIGDKQVKKTVELQPSTKESAVKRQLGL